MQPDQYQKHEQSQRGLFTFYKQQEENQKYYRELQKQKHLKTKSKSKSKKKLKKNKVKAKSQIKIQKSDQNPQLIKTIDVKKQFLKKIINNRLHYHQDSSLGKTKLKTQPDQQQEQGITQSAHRYHESAQIQMQRHEQINNCYDGSAKSLLLFSNQSQKQLQNLKYRLVTQELMGKNVKNNFFRMKTDNSAMIQNYASKQIWQIMKDNKKKKQTVCCLPLQQKKLVPPQQLLYLHKQKLDKHIKLGHDVKVKIEPNKKTKQDVKLKYDIKAEHTIKIEQDLKLPQIKHNRMSRALQNIDDITQKKLTPIHRYNSTKSKKNTKKQSSLLQIVSSKSASRNQGTDNSKSDNIIQQKLINSNNLNNLNHNGSNINKKSVIKQKATLLQISKIDLIDLQQQQQQQQQQKQTEIHGQWQIRKRNLIRKLGMEIRI